MNIDYNVDDRIIVAVPSITQQKKVICAGNQVDAVYRYASEERGYKNPVVFSTYLSILRNNPDTGNKEKSGIEYICSKAIAIPMHLIENPEEFFEK